MDNSPIHGYKPAVRPKQCAGKPVVRHWQSFTSTTNGTYSNAFLFCVDPPSHPGRTIPTMGLFRWWLGGREFHEEEVVLAPTWRQVESHQDLVSIAEVGAFLRNYA